MEACRDLCLTAPYRCHSFDYGDTGQRVCRLSHHTSVTLTQIQVGTHNTLTTNYLKTLRVTCPSIKSSCRERYLGFFFVVDGKTVHFFE